MALEDELNGHNDIAQFLEKFKEQPFPQQKAEDSFASRPPAAPVRPAQYARSFEKLEQKIHELEEKFEASTTQNQLILTELSRTREVMERQKDKDAFLEHLSRTIATLRTSVENLSQAQQTQSFTFREAPVQRSFDPLPTVFAPTGEPVAGDAYVAAQEAAQLRRERDEQTRLFNSLRQKASQLKAVNSALDREIKKTQQEKLDALKKSADQAKEILSLRDQLTAAEERFKAFDFEGRVISIKKEYQQKVATLETQLKEMSDKCIKQVEEIESLKAENTKLQAIATQKEVLQAQLADKDKQLAELKNSIAALQNQHSDQHQQKLAAFTTQLRMLEEQRDRLAVELEQSQLSLGTVRREKEMLEKNFKELVEKINQNDGEISKLKEKIDVLGAQNAQLAQQNEQLTQANSVLSHNNQALSQTNVELTHRNAALTQHNVTLTRHSQTLEQEKNTLTQRVRVLNGQVENKEKAPAAQKEPARNKSAALLAARLVQKHAQPEHSDSPKNPVSIAAGASLRRPAAPVLHSLGRTISAAPTENEWEVIRAKHSTATQPAVKSIKSADDLPEIKVADPVPQDDLFDGEDFLTKTDTFIGRMKWSIFRENR